MKLPKNSYNHEAQLFRGSDYRRNDNRQFVCVEVLRPSQPNRVMSNAVSLHNHRFTGQT